MSVDVIFIEMETCKEAEEIPEISFVCESEDAEIINTYLIPHLPHETSSTLKVFIISSCDLQLTNHIPASIN